MEEGWGGGVGGERGRELGVGAGRVRAGAGVEGARKLRATGAWGEARRLRV